MTREEFNHFTIAVHNIGMAVPVISTGLPVVDMAVDELKYIRAVEILTKIKNMDNFTTAERHALKWILDLGDLDIKIKELNWYWANRKFNPEE